MSLINKKLEILVDVLKSNYSKYYKKYIGHDFLDSIKEYNNSDNIAYLIEHVKKLNENDEEYPVYLQYCYAIFNELRKEVELELEVTTNNYLEIIYTNIDIQGSDIENAVLIGLFANPNNLYNLKKEQYSEVVIKLIEKYKIFEGEKVVKLSLINKYSDYFKDKLKI